MSFFYKYIKKIYEHRDSFFFYPSKEILETPADYDIQYEDIYINYKNVNNINNKIHGWYCRNNNKYNKVIFYLHGNGGNISTRLNYVNLLYKFGYSLMIIDYPGFGYSEGSSTEESCINVCKLFYDYLLNIYDNDNIILHGESIGCSIAVKLSNIYKTKNIILLSPFTSIYDIINETFIFGFMISFLCNGFNTLEYLKERSKMINYETKSLYTTILIHSKEDRLINCSHSEILLKYSTKLIYINGDHTVAEITEEYIDEISNLLRD